MRRRGEPAIVLGLTALGAALRLWGLGDRSLWADEIANANTAHQPGLGAVLAALPVDQMPLHVLLMFLASGLGTDEVAVRLASVVAGILAVPALYLLARRLAGFQAAPWTALLAALSAFLVWYAQDATNYSLLILTSSLAAWAVHRAAGSPRLEGWVLAAFALAATAYSHYAGPLVVVALLAWALVEVVRQRDALRTMGALTAGMLVAALLAPWLPWIRAYLTFAPPLATKVAAADLPWAWQPVRLGFGLGLLPLAGPLAVAGVVSLRRRRTELEARPKSDAWSAAPMRATRSSRLERDPPDQGVPATRRVAGLLAASSGPRSRTTWCAPCGPPSRLRDRRAWPPQPGAHLSAAPLGLLVAWLLLPAATLVASAGVHAFQLPLRYFAAAEPPVLVLAGAGVAALLRWGGAARLRVSARVVAVMVITLGALPQLVVWGGQPKDDWRGAAAAIRAGGGRPAAIALGFGSLWAAPDLGYYLARQVPAVTVVDGEAGADPAGAAALATAQPVFAVFNSDRGPSDLRTDGRAATGDFQRIADVPSGLTVTRLVGVTVVRAERLDDLLGWASRLEPEARAWMALAGAAPATGALALDSERRALVTPGDVLAARFSCSGGRAAAVLWDARGRALADYPSPAGAECGDGRIFAFTVPARAVAASLVVTGAGSFSRLDVVRLGLPPP